MATTAERIKQLRKKKGLSQAELAERIGVKNNTVSTWERGTRKPDFEALDNLSDFFEVSFEYILGNTEDDTPRKKPTDEELNKLALSDLAGEVYNTFEMYCRLGEKSRKLIAQFISDAYRLDKEDGELMPADPFKITIVPNE